MSKIEDFSKLYLEVKENIDQTLQQVFSIEIKNEDGNKL